MFLYFCVSYRKEGKTFRCHLSTAHYIECLCNIFFVNTVTFKQHVILFYISWFCSNSMSNLLDCNTACSENIKYNTLDGSKLLIYGIDVRVIFA